MPVLGVCLGAQLLAHALGGEVRRLARRHLDWLRARPLPAADGDPVLGALPPGAAGSTGTRTASRCRRAPWSCCARPAGSGEGFRAGRALVGRAVPPRARRARARALVRRLAAALGRPAVTEAEARAADREHMPGQRALSEAIFGGFARVVRGPRVGSASMAEQICTRRRHRHRYETFGDPARSRAAARHGPRDADDRLARGLLRASSPAAAST